MPTPFDFEVPADSTPAFAQPRPTSTEDVAAAQATLDANRPTLGEAASAAFELENSVAAFERMRELDSLQTDPDFVLSKPLLDELSVGVDPQYHERFTEARSEPHARKIRELLLDEVKQQEIVSQRGWQGVGLQVGAAILDPVALGMTAATGGAYATFSKASRLRRFISAGGLAAGENVALESLISSASQTRDTTDLLYAGIGGFILGGGIAAIPRNANDRALRAAEAAADALDQRVLRDAGLSTIDTPKVSPVVLADDATEQLAASLDEADGLLNAGAAQVRSQPVVPDDFTAAQHDAPKSALGAVRMDIVGRLKQSPIGPVRWLAGQLAEDAVGNADRSIPTEIGASEIASNLRARWETQFYRTANGAFDEWIQENKLPWIARHTQRDGFFEAVTEAVRTGHANSPAVQRAASSMRDIFADVLGKAKAAGVYGFDNIEPNGRYVTRLFSADQIRTLDARYGTDAVESLLRGAIRSATDLDEDMAGKLARGYWKKLRRYGAGLDTHIARGLSPEATDVLREVLEESKLPAEEIDRIFAAIHPDSTKQPVTRARKRTLLDEDFAMKLRNPETGQLDVVPVSRLFENNAEKIMSTYLTQLSGHVALAQKGIKSRADFKKVLEQIQSTAAHDGLPTRAIENQISALQRIYDHITGAPLEADPMSVFAQTGRILRDTNFTRVMNQTGFAQLAEMGNLLSMGGIRTLAAHLPEFGAMLKRAKNGTLEADELADELEEWVALGTDRLRHPLRPRIDERNQSFDLGVNPSRGALTAVNSGLKKYDAAVQVGKKITSDISLMAPLTLLQQRLAMKSIAQKFVNLANGDKRWKAERLAALGLTPEMTERVLTQIRKHTDQAESRLFIGRKLKRLNMEKWMDDDPEAANAFIMSTYRLGRRIIQENDVGNLPLFVHSTLGKLLFQFRTFMLGAWTKQLLHNLHMRDIESTGTFLFSSMVAGAAYVAQTQINSLGRADREEWLKKRLDAEEIGKAAFQRAGYSSLLPAAWDTFSTLTVADKPTFAYGRSTGLASGLITGNPTVDLVNNAARAVKGAVASPLREDYQYSQDDAAATTSLLWFQNAMGVRNVLNAIVTDLPEDSR